MFSNLSVFLVSFVVGMASVVVALFQTYPTWKKQGFSVPRSSDETKIVKKYRTSSRRKITSWTYVSIFIAYLVFGILMTTQTLLKTQVIIVCFTYAFVLGGGFYLFAVLIDQHIRRK